MPHKSLHAGAGLYLTFDALHAALAAEGIALFSVAPAADLLPKLARASNALSVWQSAGHAGSMEYMLRPPQLYRSFEHVLAETRSVVTIIVPYATPPGKPANLRRACDEPSGLVARYAWGRDYHKVLRRLLRRVLDRVRSGISGDEILQARIFADAVPLLERALATSVGKTFIGRNSLVIRPGTGSFTFIAELLWNVSIRGIPSKEREEREEYLPPASGCKRCSRCLPACPTGAIVADGIISAPRCISYLTIEKRGVFTPAERSMVGQWLFGCDICQEVCPFNHPQCDSAAHPALARDEPLGPALPLREIFALRTQHDFLRRFAGTALMRTGRVGLLRNAAAVAQNLGDPRSLRPLLDCATSDDSEIVRSEAAAALATLREKTDGALAREIDAFLQRARDEEENISLRELRGQK